jgi:AraC-type DNA-binding domain-containing proteins
MDHHKVVEDALTHIENNLQEPLSVDSVASAFNLSKFYFHRLFSAMMGCSLSQYILTRRLNASLTFSRKRRIRISSSFRFSTTSVILKPRITSMRLSKSCLLILRVKCRRVAFYRVLLY